MKKIFTIFSILFGILLGASALSVMAQSVWTAPTAPPPGNNTPAPINVGNLLQTKIGGLWLESGLRVDGNVLIGTSSPSWGKVLMATDRDGTAAWVATSSLGLGGGGGGENPPPTPDVSGSRKKVFSDEFLFWMRVKDDSGLSSELSWLFDRNGGNIENIDTELNHPGILSIRGINLYSVNKINLNDFRSIELIAKPTNNIGFNFFGLNDSQSSDTNDARIGFHRINGLKTITSTGAATTQNTISYPSNNSWHSYKIVRENNSLIRFYVDGIEVTTHTTNIPNDDLQVVIENANPSYPLHIDYFELLLK